MSTEINGVWFFNLLHPLMRIFPLKKRYQNRNIVHRNTGVSVVWWGTKQSLSASIASINGTGHGSASFLCWGLWFCIILIYVLTDFSKHLKRYKKIFLLISVLEGINKLKSYWGKCEQCNYVVLISLRSPEASQPLIFHSIFNINVYFQG